MLLSVCEHVVALDAEQPGCLNGLQQTAVPEPSKALAASTLLA
jgi:hypothetical protein